MLTSSPLPSHEWGSHYIVTVVVRRHEGKTPEYGFGDGQEAWKLESA